MYSCKTGFAKVSGSNYLQCVDVDGKGVWIGDLPSCKKHISAGIANSKNITFFK